MTYRLRYFQEGFRSYSKMVPIFISSFGLGIALGGYIPLVAMWLGSIGFSFSFIGLISGASSIGVILSAFLTPKIVEKIGYLNSAFLGILLASLAGLAFRLFHSEAIWILLRISAGLGFGLHWAVSEAWLGQLAIDKTRTKALSFYVSAMALGFSVGPILIWITGISTVLPFILICCLQIVSVFPLIAIRGIQPKHQKEIKRSPFFLVKASPAIAAGCILVGVVDLSLVSLIPVLVQRTPTAAVYLAFLLPVIAGFGNVILQFPLALMSEKIGTLRTAYLITIFGTLLCAAIPFSLHFTFLSLLLAFFGCGVIYFMYTISLSMLSEKFKGNKLLSANASFIILFETASLLGPLIAGLLLDKSSKFGLSAFLIASGIAYLSIRKYFSS